MMYIILDKNNIWWPNFTSCSQCLQW